MGPSPAMLACGPQTFCRTRGELVMETGFEPTVYELCLHTPHTRTLLVADLIGDAVMLGSDRMLSFRPAADANSRAEPSCSAIKIQSRTKAVHGNLSGSMAEHPSAPSSSHRQRRTVDLASSAIAAAKVLPSRETNQRGCAWPVGCDEAGRSAPGKCARQVSGVRLRPARGKWMYGCIGEVVLYGEPFRTERTLSHDRNFHP